MISSKKLQGGGDTEVPKMQEDASLVGVDLIEVLWIPVNGRKRNTVAGIVGFKKPIVDDINPLDDEADITSGWIETTLKFYPDGRGNCWGYIFDTPYNRTLIYSGLSTGRFKIVDRKIREEIYKEAEEAGYSIQRTQKKEVILKVSTRERNAEERTKTLEKQLQDKKDQIKKLEEDLAVAKNEKIVRVTKRLKGKKIPNRDEILEGEEENKE